MPTGSGKSAVAVGYAVITGQPTCILTESRGLQDQYLEDFAGLGMVDIRGKRNYDCDLKPGYSCEDGQAARCRKSGTIHCPLSSAEMRAATSRLVMTNYDKWTSARKYGQGMSHFTQVVFDEGQRSPEALARAMQVMLSFREVDDLLGMDLPRTQEVVDWRIWAIIAQSRSVILMAHLKSSFGDDPKPSQVRRYTHLRNLTRRLATLATCQPQNWVVDELETGFQFDPVRVSRYSEATLLLHVPSVVAISATIRKKTLFMIGIGSDTFDYKEFQSDFDPSRCPIYYIPTMRVDKNHPDLSMLWVCHDRIGLRRTDRKGITHTISYMRRDSIVGHSLLARSMMVNPKGEASTSTIQQFRRSPPGTILVSPSVGAGFDFPGKDCEWQFVCKIPFGDSRSKIVRARQEDDKEYGPYQAMTALEQIFGRAMRQKWDQCEGFIGDMHLDWFLPRYGHYASAWFHKRFRRVEVVPPPPPPL